MQNSIVRIINFKFIRDKVKMCTLYKSMKLLKVKDIYELEIANFKHSFHNNLLLKNLMTTSKLLVIIMIITLDPLLKTTSIKKEPILDVGNNVFLYSGIKIWNKIPINLKHLNRFLFSKNIKKSIVANY